MIPQCSPVASYLAHRHEIDSAINRVLNSGSYILGEEVMEFEREFAQFLKIDYAVGVASGTDALELALRAYNIGSGDAVITVSHTAVATVAAIVKTGAVPVFIDIDPETCLISTPGIESFLAGNPDIKSRAIIPVHLYGQPADMEPIMNIAARYGMKVIEDCSQAHGALINGKRAGTFGDIACFSCYPTKNLGAIGDGGILVTKDRDIMSKLKLLREYGWKERNNSEIRSGSSRLDEIQAAILRIKLKYLEDENRRRNDIAGIYSDSITAPNIKLPVTVPGTYNVYHQYTVRVDNRDELKAFLAKKGVHTAIHYPIPVHSQKAYVDAGYVPEALISTEKTVSRILSLPIFPQLMDSDVLKVTQAINEFIGI